MCGGVCVCVSVCVCVCVRVGVGVWVWVCVFLCGCGCVGMVDSCMCLWVSVCDGLGCSGKEYK